MIRQWRHRACAPRPDKALMIIHLSKQMLDWKMIYEPFAIKKLRAKSK
jgi:hypothetical protein